MRFGFYSNPTAAAGAPMRCPRLALNRSTMQKPNGKTTQQYLETEIKLCSGSEKPQGEKKKGKNVASISEFYQGKLQEYLVC